MCKNAYEKLSERTGKIMVFCKALSKDTELPKLCIKQRFCPDKDKYIELERSKVCKYYND